MTIYLKFEGIDGDVTEDKHKGWISVDSFQFGVGRGISTPVGDTARRESSKPSVSEVVVTKSMDKSSLKLWSAALVEQTGKKVQVDFVRSGTKGGLETFAQYELTNCLVSGYSVSSGGDTPTESVSLNFTKVMFKYIAFDGTNATGNAANAIFDLASTKMS